MGQKYHSTFQKFVASQNLISLFSPPSLQHVKYFFFVKNGIWTDILNKPMTRIFEKNPLFLISRGLISLSFLSSQSIGDWRG